MRCENYKSCGVDASTTCHDNSEARGYCGKYHIEKEKRGGFGMTPINVEEGATFERGTLTLDKRGTLSWHKPKE